MIKVLSISGSPTESASTDILLDSVRQGLIDGLAPEPVEVVHFNLNSLFIMPCQSCGKAPAPDYCFYHDDADKIYQRIADCDCLLFGSPIYFDNVSAQAKLLIDRCNCFRPADFENADPEHSFLKLLPRKRPGAIILVGGTHGWFEGARRTIVGFFKWIEIASEGMVTFAHEDFDRGTVNNHADVMAQARALGAHLADTLRTKYARP